MTAPAVAKGSAAQLPGRRESRAFDRWAGLVEGWLKGHAILTYAFLYLPIFVVVLFAFNDTTRRVTAWDGFSTKWFEEALKTPEITNALKLSILIALGNALVACVLGTMLALALPRMRPWVRTPIDALAYMTLVTPEIVFGTSLLAFFSVWESTALVASTFARSAVTCALLLPPSKRG